MLKILIIIFIINIKYLKIIKDVNLINTEFDYNYKYVRDLPEDMKCQAIDCIGTSLGCEPKYPGDGYISNAYKIYKLYFNK